MQEYMLGRHDKSGKVKLTGVANSILEKFMSTETLVNPKIEQCIGKIIVLEMARCEGFIMGLWNDKIVVYESSSKDMILYPVLYGE